MEFIKINEQITLAQSHILKGNAVIIDCGIFLTLVDTLLLPKDISLLNDFLLNKHKPLKYLINTHWHSDHCIGNAQLKQQNTTIIAHNKYLNTLITEKNMLNPHRKSLSALNNISHPNICINNDLFLNDDLKLSLLCTPGHSHDSISVFLPDQNILISGDSVLGHPENFSSIPYFYWGDSELFHNSLLKIKDLNPNLILPGHSNPVKSDILDSHLEYLQNLKKLATDILMNNSNLSLDEFVKLLPPHVCLKSLKNAPLWVPEMHTLNLERFFLTNSVINNSL